MGKLHNGQCYQRCCFYAGSYSSIKTQALTGRHGSNIKACCVAVLSLRIVHVLASVCLRKYELVWLWSNGIDWPCSSCPTDGCPPPLLLGWLTLSLVTIRLDLCCNHTHAPLPHHTDTFCSLHTQILHAHSCCLLLPYLLLTSFPCSLAQLHTHARTSSHAH